MDVDATPLASMNKGERATSSGRSPGWSTRFRNAHTEDIGDYEAVMAWLAEHQPDDVGQLPDPQRLPLRQPGASTRTTRPARSAVLDWEMATVGDPLMDLGGTLAYWVQDDDDEFFRQFRRQPTNLPGMLSRAEVVDYYCERTGCSVTPEQWRFYEVYGLFRLGVIAQQIYYRYFHRQTTNEAYAIFGPAAAPPRGALPARSSREARALSGPAAAGPARPGVVGRPTTTTCSPTTGWEQSRAARQGARCPRHHARRGRHRRHASAPGDRGGVPR